MSGNRDTAASHRSLSVPWNFYSINGTPTIGWGAGRPMTTTRPILRERTRSKSHYCIGCGADVADGPFWTRASDPAFCVCCECAGDPEPAEPVARIRVSPETMQILMDGAADEIADHRVSIIAIVWDEEVEREDAHRLSRTWAAAISKKPVVTMTRVRVYGDRRLEAVA